LKQTCRNQSTAGDAGPGLATLARRINARERRSRREQLAHVEAQAEDLALARAEVERARLPGGWRRWVDDNLEVGRARTYHYLKFREECLVTRHLTEEQKWDLWQCISGNAPARDADPLTQSYDGVDRSSPPTPPPGRGAEEDRFTPPDESRFTVLVGDCRKLMQDMPDGSVDAVVTDPPYGTGAWFRPGNGRGRDPRAVPKKEHWDVWSTDWLDQAWRIAKHAVGLFAPPRQLPSLFAWVGDRPWRMYAWVKPDPRPRFGGQQAYGFDPFIVIGKVQPVGGKDYFQAPSPRGQGGVEVRAHDHQKPVKLMEWCTGLCCPQGGTVLDPFTGSGSTGVACLRTGRTFTGIELDPEWASYAGRRLAGFRPGAAGDDDNDALLALADRLDLGVEAELRRPAAPGDRQALRTLAGRLSGLARDASDWAQGLARKADGCGRKGLLY
jgi:site-specific DNA-methyltransferase (adenine-specific)